MIDQFGTQTIQVCRTIYRDIKHFRDTRCDKSIYLFGHFKNLQALYLVGAKRVKVLYVKAPANQPSIFTMNCERVK
jgi:hypothetical protein